MSRRSVHRLGLSLALLLLGVAGPLTLAPPASAVIVPTQDPSLTIGVVGYGKVVTASASSMTPCQSPGTNAGISGAGTGHEYDCSTYDPSIFDHCTTTTYPDGSSSICDVTLTPAVVDASGWAFDHWSGDCSGTGNCTLPTEDSECDTSGLKPVCTTTSYTQHVVANFRDTRAPVTVIGTPDPAAGAVNWSDTRSATFGFGSTNENYEIMRSECQHDAGTWQSCASPATWSAIADGVHTFCVRQYDGSGLVSTPACRTWDQELPVTASVAAMPAGDTTDSGAPVSFTFSSNKASHPADGSSLQYLCALDANTLVACPPAGTARSGLANGTHTMHVVARFKPVYGSTTDSPPASYTWVQDDTTAPTVTFSLPDDRISIGTPELTYVADDAHATITCKVDDSPVTCAGTEPALPATNGVHTLEVHAVDAVGNGAYHYWHWDRQDAPPIAVVSSGPGEGASATSPSARFGLTSSLPNSTFACNLDAAGWVPCSDPNGAEDTGPLALGTHNLSVRATYHSGLGDTLTGPVTTRHWAVGAVPTSLPTCTVEVAHKIRKRRLGATITCTGAAAVTVSGTVKLGHRKLSVGHGRMVTAGGTMRTTWKVPGRTWRAMRPGHRYRATITATVGGVATIVTVKVRR